MLLTQEIPLHCELVTTTPPQQAPLLLLKKKKKNQKTLHKTLRPQHSSPLWALKVWTHCVACLASSVGGEGQAGEVG